MSDTSRIPIPLAQRWKTIRFQVLPYFFFVFCVLTTAVLWNRHAGSPNSVGEVFAQRINLTSTGEGILQEVPGQRLELFQEVSAGQVIARIDDGAIKGELDLYKGQLAMMIAAVKGTQEEMKLEHEDRMADYRENRRRLEEMYNKARLEARKAKRDMDEAKADLEGVDAHLKFIEEVNRPGRNISRVEELTLKRDQTRLKKVISESKAVLDEMVTQGVAAKKELDALTPPAEPDLEVLSAEAAKEAEAQQMLIDATERRLKGLEIRAPIDGVISTLYYRPGATLKVGEPILTIAATKGQFILAYIRQGRNLEPQPTMMVDVRRRVVPLEIGTSYIERVGSQVELVPANHCTDPRSMEWGLPVQISIPKDLKLRPGEMVDLRLIAGGPLSQVFPVQSGGSEFSVAHRETVTGAEQTALDN